MYDRNCVGPRRWSALATVWLLALPPSVHALDAEAELEKCETLAKEALDFYHSLPTAFYTGNEEADRWATQSHQTLGKCQEALHSCKGALKPEKYAEVQFVAAKILYILSKRYRLQLLSDLKKDPTLSADELSDELQRHFNIYLGEVHTLARAAYDALPPEHPLRPRALETLGFSLHEAREYAESEKVYKEFISNYADDKRVDSVVNALGRTYLDGERYAPGIKLLQKALREHYASESYPYFVETLRKLQVGKGDIAGFEQTVKQGMMVFPLKAKSTRAPGHVRNVCDRLYLYYGFWKGYGRMAAGDLDGARAAFREHVDLINSREQAEQARKQQLRPEYAIYRGRSAKTLSFLDQLAERPAPRELDLDWVTDRRVLLSDSLGKVVGILFRRVDDERSQGFMRELSHVCAVKPELELAAVHYLRAGQAIALRRLELEEELSATGYTAAAGFDPDAEKQSIFRAYDVRIGSATFVIVDREGNLISMTEDPRKQDVGFLTSVMLRAAKSP